ncbi:NAD(P)/FAD-dependent oxidoreductase [Patescibacteria group bacterium]|nr:NAD(P)/FAD-dependent oxidoreductase [Patescibacteria group bacterium]MBU1931187.1 NAD(P)/FAD-dependent oxidoreductase [Patescibacteria group bacterium]
MKRLFELAVIGGGPAGMMAAIAAGKKVCLIEKNQALGQKFLLTGKGRCNLTNIKEIPEFIDQFGQKGRFLYSALTKFSNQDLISFLSNRGIKTKVERGGRVFPENDQAGTILNCLKQELARKKVTIVYNFSVKKLTSQTNLFKISSQDKEVVLAKKVVLATGGKSYPATGSTGDGYFLAKKLGHKIAPLQPALAALIVRNPEIRSLAGLSLKNVQLNISAEQTKLVSFFGEMLFTHQGISGPIVLKSSKQVFQAIKQGKQIVAAIDLKPALNEKILKQRIYREIKKAPKKEYQSLLKTLLPKLLINLAIEKTAIEQHRKNGSLTKQEVLRLRQFLKSFSFEIHQVAPIETAIVTSGGVDVSQIDSRTMESKLVPGLFFAGEIIALDGPTGGFNLQKAFSTGYLAGQSAKI